MRYKTLDHPSELRLWLYGKTLEELFSNAVLAMIGILKRNADDVDIHTDGADKENIKIESVVTLLFCVCHGICIIDSRFRGNDMQGGNDNRR